MQSRAFIKLLQRIPREQHDSLVLMTSTGTDITIQTVLRMEEDYLAIRGRLAGTTEGGRIFFIPYDQINYLGIQKELKEPEVQALLGGAAPLPPAVQRILDTPSRAETQPEAVTAPPPEPISVAGAVPTSPLMQARPADKMVIPRRSGLIARLRARTNVSGTPEAPADK